jgi:hypothetical protein
MPARLATVVGTSAGIYPAVSAILVARTAAPLCGRGGGENGSFDMRQSMRANLLSVYWDLAWQV